MVDGPARFARLEKSSLPDPPPTDRTEQSALRLERATQPRTRGSDPSESHRREPAEPANGQCTTDYNWDALRSTGYSRRYRSLWHRPLSRSRTQRVNHHPLGLAEDRVQMDLTLET